MHHDAIGRKSEPLTTRWVRSSKLGLALASFGGSRRFQELDEDDPWVTMSDVLYSRTPNKFPLAGFSVPRRSWRAVLVSR